MTDIKSIERIFAQWGMTLYDVADTYNYSKMNKDILTATDISDLVEYQELIQKVMTLNHNRDNRSVLEFLKDIVANWLIEDYIKQLLEMAGFTVTFGGTDSNREFQYNSNVKTNTDFIIEKNGIKRNVELQVSYTNWWKTVKEVFLRDNKYQHLYTRGDILLCVDFSDFTFTYIDFNKGNYMYRFSPKEEHKQIPKDGYQIYVGDHAFSNLELLNEIEL